MYFFCTYVPKRVKFIVFVVSSRNIKHEEHTGPLLYSILMCELVWSMAVVKSILVQPPCEHARRSNSPIPRSNKQICFSQFFIKYQKCKKLQANCKIILTSLCIGTRRLVEFAVAIREKNGIPSIRLSSVFTIFSNQL